MMRIFVCFLFLLYSELAVCQFDSSAKRVLDAVSLKYQTFNTLEADISLSMPSDEDMTQLQHGKVSLERMSGKYRISLGQQEIISDGVNQWTILPQQSEIQITKVEKDDSSLTPVTFFTFFKNGYSGTYAGSSKIHNRTIEKVILIPIEKGKSVSKIELRVDKANSLIYDATVFDKNGDRYIYTIENLISNQVIPYSFFIFNKNKYPSMEIVDLR